MKPYQKLFLILVWALVLIQTGINLTAKNDYKLVEAFEASQTIPMEGKVIVSGYIGKERMNRAQKEHLLKSLAEQLGIGKGYELTSEYKEAITTMTLKKKGENGTIWMRISSVQKRDYLMTEISIEEVEQVIVMRECLEEILKKEGISTESSLMVHGTFGKVLTRQEKEQAEEELIHILHAKKVLEYKDSYQDTIYCYSPLLTDSYEKDGEKINIQILLVYDEAGDATQLYLAVPFYDESY